MGAAFTKWQWDWLHGVDPATTASTTLRNMGLLIGGGLAAVFAAWRGWVGERQSATAQQQADIADEGLLYDRYQRGSQMLGEGNLAVRLAGIYSLQRLAEENPEQYDELIMKQFCAYVRNHTEDDESLKARSEKSIRRDRVTPEDVLAALAAIRDRCHKGNMDSRLPKFTVDLSGASLIGCDLSEMDLSDANLYGANLTHCDLSGSTLSGAHLGRATLHKANLDRCALSSASIWRTDLSEISAEETDFSNTAIFKSNLSEAKLTKASLNGTMFDDTVLVNASLKEADLSWAMFSTKDDELAAISLKFGLTQAQLNEARWDSRTPPYLNGLLDAKTLQPLR